jgi:hypothetical protein
MPSLRSKAIVMDTIVETRQGALRGGIIEGIHAFKGVPFAVQDREFGHFESVISLSLHPPCAWIRTKSGLRQSAAPAP